MRYYNITFQTLNATKVQTRAFTETGVLNIKAKCVTLL